LPSFNIPISLIAFLGGFQNALYWIPLHILFARGTKEKTVGSSTGKLFALPQIASMAGPLIGGFIATILGFKVLFGFTFLILLTSVIPFIGSKSIKTKFTFKLSRGIQLFKKYPKYFFAEIFDNIGEEVEAIIWPIFIYLSLLNIASVGIAGTLLGFGSIAFTLFVGKISDKFNKKKIIKTGAILLFIVWLLRYLSGSELSIYILTVLAGIFTVLLLIPYNSLLYSIGKRDAMDEFFVFREIPVVIGRIAILSLALLFISNIKITFPLAGLSYLYFLFF
jgi:MFS family permease